MTRSGLMSSKVKGKEASHVCMATLGLVCLGVTWHGSDSDPRRMCVWWVRFVWFISTPVLLSHLFILLNLTRPLLECLVPRTLENNALGLVNAEPDKVVVAAPLVHIVLERRRAGLACLNQVLACHIWLAHRALDVHQFGTRLAKVFGQLLSGFHEFNQSSV